MNESASAPFAAMPCGDFREPPDYLAGAVTHALPLPLF